MSRTNMDYWSMFFYLLQDAYTAVGVASDKGVIHSMDVSVPIQYPLKPLLKANPMAHMAILGDFENIEF